jgi:hypothetical protein
MTRRGRRKSSNGTRNNGGRKGNGKSRGNSRGSHNTSSSPIPGNTPPYPDTSRLERENERLKNRIKEQVDQITFLQSENQALSANEGLDKRVEELESTLQAKDGEITTLRSGVERLEDELVRNRFDPDNPDILFENYLRQHLPRMKEAAEEFDSLSYIDESTIRKYLALSNLSLIEVLSSFLVESDIETRDIDEIKRRMQACATPFEERDDFDSKIIVYKTAQGRLEHRRFLEDRLVATEEYLEDIRTRLQTDIDMINVEEEQAKIDAYETEIAEYNTWHGLYTKTWKTVERFEDEHEEATGIIENIKSRIKRNLKSVCLIRNGEEMKDYTITIMLPSDEEFDKTRFGIELVAEYILNEEFFRGVYPDNAKKSSFKIEEPELALDDGLKRIVYRFPKDSVQNQDLCAFQERFIRRLREKYASSNMALLGFDLEIWDFNKHLVRRYDMAPEDKIELAVTDISSVDEFKDQISRETETIDGKVRGKERGQEGQKKEETEGYKAPEFRPTLKREKLREILELYKIDLEEEYMGCNRTAGELADEVLEAGQEMHLVMDPRDYDLQKTSSKRQALLWLKVETELAKNGEEFTIRRKTYDKIVEFFNAPPSSKIRKQINDAFTRMGQKGLAEVEDRGEKSHYFRLSPSRWSGAGIPPKQPTPQTHQKPQTPQTPPAEDTGGLDEVVQEPGTGHAEHAGHTAAQYDRSESRDSSRGIASFEQLCETLTEYGVELDERYKGSYKTARALAEGVWKDTQETGLVLDPEIYGFRLDASKDRLLLWMLVEAEVAKSGAVFNRRGESLSNLKALFQDPYSMKDDFSNAYKKMKSKGILEVKKTGGKNHYYRINPTRIRVGSAPLEEDAEGLDEVVQEGRAEHAEHAGHTAAQYDPGKRNSIASFEQLCETLTEYDIELDERYKGSYKTARELAKGVWKDAQETGLILNHEGYGFRMNNSRDRLLLWMMVETEVAKSGAEHKPRGTSYQKVAKEFEDVTGLRKTIDNCYTRMALRGILERDRSERNSLWRVNPSQFSGFPQRSERSDGSIDSQVKGVHTNLDETRSAVEY